MRCFFFCQGTSRTSTRNINNNGLPRFRCVNNYVFYLLLDSMLHLFCNVAETFCCGSLEYFVEVFAIWLNITILFISVNELKYLANYHLLEQIIFTQFLQYTFRITKLSSLNYCYHNFTPSYTRPTNLCFNFTEYACVVAYSQIILINDQISTSKYLLQLNIYMIKTFTSVRSHNRTTIIYL